MKPSEERYQESFVVNDRADWMLIKDRATGKVILVNADDRVDCPPQVAAEVLKAWMAC